MCLCVYEEERSSHCAQLAVKPTETNPLWSSLGSGVQGGMRVCPGGGEVARRDELANQDTEGPREGFERGEWVGIG